MDDAEGCCRLKILVIFESYKNHGSDDILNRGLNGYKDSAEVCGGKNHGPP